MAEEVITKTSYTKEEISIKINKDYKAGIKSLELDQINHINQNKDFKKLKKDYQIIRRKLKFEN